MIVAMNLRDKVHWCFKVGEKYWKEVRKIKSKNQLKVHFVVMMSNGKISCVPEGHSEQNLA